MAQMDGEVGFEMWRYKVVCLLHAPSGRPCLISSPQPSFLKGSGIPLFIQWPMYSQNYNHCSMVFSFSWTEDETQDHSKLIEIVEVPD